MSRVISRQANRFTNPRRAALAGVAVALLLVPACSTDSASEPEGDTATVSFPDNKATGSPVKIGLINPEGGPAVSLPGNREAAVAATEYANAHLGGIAGHPIELVQCSNKEDPASARDCANQMVEAGVSAVVVTTTGQGESMAPIITGSGISYIAPNGSSNAELSSPNAFMLTSGFPGMLMSMASYAGSQGYDKVTAFVSDNNSAVPATQGIGGPAFQAAGVELQIVPVAQGTPDAAPQVSAGLSGKPDAVAVIGDATLCTSLIKALSTLGSDADTMLIQPCMDPSTVQAVGSMMDGAHVFTTSDITSSDPEAVLYRSVMQQFAPDTDIEGFTVTGYQGILGLVRATAGLQGEPTAGAVSAAIAAAKNVVLPAGHGITFACDGSALPALPAVCSTGLVSATVVDGKTTDPQLAK